MLGRFGSNRAGAGKRLDRCLTTRGKGTLLLDRRAEAR